VVPAAWFTVLALGVAGPLLAFNGYLLLLDWPSGPQFPRVDFFPDPSSAAIGNTAPLDAIHAGLRGLNQYLPDKLFLVAPILLGGIGLYRLARSRLEVGSWGGILGGTLFVVNPWVIDRYLSGHLHILLAYALLPWALLPLYDGLREPSLRPTLVAGVWLFGLGMIDLHIAGMYALLAAVCLLASPPRRRLLYAGVALGLGAVLSAWWLVPALLSPSGIRVGTADLAVYASRPRGLEVLPNLAAMYGFWRNEFVGPAGRVSLLYLLLIPILGLVIWGAVRLMAAGQSRRFAVVLAATGMVALLLAGGTSFPPTAGVFRWVYDHVYAFRIYREPQKFLALVVLAYAIFASVGLGALIASRARWLAAAFGGVSLAAVLAYGFTLFGGFWDQVHLSRYPRDWYAAERVITQSERTGTLVVLPWELYAVWSFSDGRIVANPAPSFFSTEVIVNREAGFVSIPEPVLDPATQRISMLLEESQPRGEFCQDLSSLGVGYVALLREADYWRYRFVQHSGLDALLTGPMLTLLSPACPSATGGG
jgi:hypothetical protein